jgi:hypothetical protein
MARKKTSAAVIVVAVINLVLGVPCLICIPTSLIASEALKGMAKQNQAAGPANPFGQIDEQERFMEKEAPGFKTIQYVASGVQVLYALGLIVSAALLLVNKPAGRYLCIAICALFAAWTIGNSVYQVSVAMPAARKYLEKRLQDLKGPPPPKGLFEASSAVGLGFNILMGVGYPLLAIALLMTPGARNTMTRHRPADLDDPRDEDYEDYEARRLRDDDDRPKNPPLE